MKQDIKHKVLASVLTIVALVAGQSALAQGPVQPTGDAEISFSGFTNGNRYYYRISSNLGQPINSGAKDGTGENFNNKSFNMGNNLLRLTMTIDGPMNFASGTSLTDVIVGANDLTLTFTTTPKYIIGARVTTSAGVEVYNYQSETGGENSISIKLGKNTTFGKVTLTVATHTPLNHATISGIEETYYYDGTNEPVPTVVVDGVTLTRDVDYTLTYYHGKNDNSSTHWDWGSVHINGIGEYIGSNGKNFNIVNVNLSEFTQLNDGSYRISTKDDLFRLACYVIGDNSSSGLTFRQTANITCDNSFMPIGIGNSHPFAGTYDGGGHTISGITLNANDNVGLFGYVNGGTVQNIVLTNSTISGNTNVGCIVGALYSGTVQNCRVESSVTINANDMSGGIVGYCQNSIGLSRDTYVKGCLCAANMNTGSTLCGIVGSAFEPVLIKDCLFIGTMNVGNGTCYSGITGLITATYPNRFPGHENNYYTTNCPGGVIYNSETIPADRDGARRARTITLGTGVTISGTTTEYNVSGLTAVGTTGLLYNGTFYSGATQTVKLNYSGGSETFTMPDMDVIPMTNGFSNNSVISGNIGSGKNVILTSRTLYKDNSWNTLCLPFSLTTQQVTNQLNPSALMTLSSSSYENGTLTLNFTDATQIDAGKPYLIKWSSGSNVVNPLFAGVTVRNTQTGIETNYIDFIGTYAPVTLTADNRTKLYLGDNDKLYFPGTDITVNAFRGYFNLKDITEGNASNNIKEFVLNFGDEADGIVSPLGETEEGAAWYDLGGRRLSDKPSAKGLYINNGKIVTIK